MPRSILLTHVLITLLAGFLTIGVSHAADPVPAEVAKKLLQDGWAKTEAARKFPTYPSLDQPPLKDDSFVLEARWLVLMFQGRDNLALDKVKAFLVKHPTSLDALHAEIWMRMKADDYNTAIELAQNLGKALPQSKPDEKLPPAEAAAVEDVLIFLGHVAGFLEGPANKANDSQRQKFENELLARLSSDQKGIFRDAKQDVLSQFNRLHEAAGGLEQGAKAKAAAAKQDKKAELGKQADDLAKAKAKADADAQKATAEQQKKTDDLKQKGARLLQEWQRLQNDRQLAQNLIKTQEDQIKQLNQQAADPKNPQAQNARISANSAQNQLNTLNAKLNYITGEIFRVEAAHRELEQQGFIGQLQGQSQGQAQMAGQKALDNKAKALANEQRRIDEDRAKQDSQAQALARKAANLNAEALAFTTYDLFPFDNMRRKLLQKLK